MKIDNWDDLKIFINDRTGSDIPFCRISSSNTFYIRNATLKLFGIEDYKEYRVLFSYSKSNNAVVIDFTKEKKGSYKISQAYSSNSKNYSIRFKLFIDFFGLKNHVGNYIPKSENINGEKKWVIYLNNKSPNFKKLKEPKE